ncbi:hypothetical protein JHW43_005130 [Diplocarpon mali]|nr:hypothetical protein JHW43_005130 [Diplocarpon mali]
MATSARPGGKRLGEAHRSRLVRCLGATRFSPAGAPPKDRSRLTRAPFHDRICATSEPPRSRPPLGSGSGRGAIATAGPTCRRGRADGRRSPARHLAVCPAGSDPIGWFRGPRLEPRVRCQAASHHRRPSPRVFPRSLRPVVRHHAPGEGSDHRRAGRCPACPAFPASPSSPSVPGPEARPPRGRGAGSSSRVMWMDVGFESRYISTPSRGYIHPARMSRVDTLRQIHRRPSTEPPPHVVIDIRTMSKMAIARTHPMSRAAASSTQDYRGRKIPPSAETVAGSESALQHRLAYNPFPLFPPREGILRGTCCLVAPYTLHPTPYILHPTPYTLHPTPYTLHPPPYTLHPPPYTLHPTPSTLHPTPPTPNHQPPTPNIQLPTPNSQPPPSNYHHPTTTIQKSASPDSSEIRTRAQSPNKTSLALSRSLGKTDTCRATIPRPHFHAPLPPGPAAPPVPRACRPAALGKRRSAPDTQFLVTDISGPGTRDMGKNMLTDHENNQASRDTGQRHTGTRRQLEVVAGDER